MEYGVSISKQLEQMPRKTGEAVTTPQSFHKARHERGVEYYKEVTYTPDGDMILNGKMRREKISISRAACNFSGAYPYLFDVLSYICAHAKGAVVDVDNYYSVIIPYDKFLELALGGHREQQHYLQNELYRLDKARQSKIIALDGQTSLYAQPVVLAYKAGDRPLSEKGKRGAEQIGVKVRGEIQILFLKCLFRDVLENDNRYIDFPKAFFAELKAAENVLEDAGAAHPACGGITSETIYKLLNYFRLHDNSESLSIRLSGIKVLKHCAPQHIKTWKDGQGNAVDGFQNTETAEAFLRLLARALNGLCRAGILNAMPETKMRNLITRIETGDGGDIIVSYGNRKRTE